MPSPDEHLNSTFTGSQVVRVRGVQTSSTSLGLLTSLKRDRVTSSVNTPNFKKLKRKRYYLPTNPYGKTFTVLSDPQMSLYSLYTEPASNNYYDEWFWQLNCSKIVGAPQQVAFADDPSQRAIANMMQKLNDTKVNTLVTAAEMHKTAAHLAKTATRIYESIRALRKGDFTGFTSVLGLTTTNTQKKRFNKRYNAAKSRDAQEHKYSESSLNVDRTQSNVSRFAGETWLEYSYGWKPLLYDVYGHARALAETSVERANVVRHVTGRSKTTSAKTVDSILVNSPLTGTDHYLKRRSDDRRWVEYGVAYKLQAGETNVFSQFGIDNPMEVAWELVPFSFVADWFIPIGDYLKSLTATIGLKFYTGYKSERRYTEDELTLDHRKIVIRGPGRTSTYVGSPFVQKEGRLLIARNPLADFPIPILPTFRNPFGNGADYGLAKALSASALLQSLFLKRATR